MITHLDHVAILVRDWDAAVGRYTALLGSAPEVAAASAAQGGRVALFALCNTRIGLVSAGPGPTDEGLVSMALGTADLAACVARLGQRGLQVNEVGAQQPPTWELDHSATRGLSLQLLARRSQPLPPAGGFAPDCVEALDHVVVRSAAPDQARALYGSALGIRLALDRELAGTRMLFFRTSGVTIEVIGDSSVSEADVLYGLALRVRDVDAAHARLAAAGFELTPPRAGRKPGTRVFSVQGPICGVPCLFIRDPSRDSPASKRTD